MSKLKSAVTAVVTFAGNVAGETKKASWPTRQELFSSTVVVIVSVLLLSLFVGVSDWILTTLLKVLTRAGGS